MKFALTLVLTLLVCLTAAPAVARDETFQLFENRKVTIEVPTGFTFLRAVDDLGLVRIQLNSKDRTVMMDLTFLPDADQRFVEGYERRRFLHETFQEFVASSVEKAMHFEELEPKGGVGTYCVFTDAALVGKDKATYPPGEYLHATKGAKAWPGVLVLFSLYSNDTTSAEYVAALDVLRKSTFELTAPLR